jgi:F-type H+-transporting ATPase subunit epsilon
MADLHCIVVTPEKTELDTQATSITVPLFDGELGILPGRAPMVGRLGFGLMTIKLPSGSTKYFVDGGFVQVTRESVCVLTDRLINPDAIDAAQAAKDLESASALKAVSAEAFAIKSRATEQARAKLRVASRKA